MEIVRTQLINMFNWLVKLIVPQVLYVSAGNQICPVHVISQTIQSRSKATMIPKKNISDL